jgi:uncharacterized protein YjbJ (UPF0337 family)
MKSNLKNRIKGSAKEAKGKMKVAAGRATKNPRMEGQGRVEKLEGKARRKLGETEKVLGD